MLSLLILSLPSSLSFFSLGFASVLISLRVYCSPFLRQILSPICWILLPPLPPLPTSSRLWSFFFKRFPSSNPFAVAINIRQGVIFNPASRDTQQHGYSSRGARRRRKGEKVEGFSIRGGSTKTSSTGYRATLRASPTCNDDKVTKIE